MRGLYAIVDIDSLSRRGVEPLPFVEAILEARPAAVQLRDKNRGARATLELLRRMAPLCRRAGVPLFANDRPDLAILAGCDGVHLGRDDVPAALARSLSSRIVGPETKLRIGLSTHNEADVDEALLEEPDYIAIGPVFPTSSKDRPSPIVGLQGLLDLAERVRRAQRSLPIVAIGGITLESARAVFAIADCAAVIGALLPEGEGAPSLEAIRDRALALQRCAEGASV